MREEPTGVIISTLRKYVIVSYFEAFILSLFDGTNSIKDLANRLKNTRGAPPTTEEIEEVIYSIIENYSDYFELKDDSLKTRRATFDSSKLLPKLGVPLDPLALPYAPIGIDLYITRRCNLNCVYCFAGARYQDCNSADERINEIDLDIINNIINQAVDLKIFRVTITGGEPTLRPDLPEIIRRFICSDIDVALPTNAYSLSDSLALKLKDAGLEQIQTKLDAADADTQDTLSGVKGSFNRITKGIKTLKKYGFEISTVAVITSRNSKGLSGLISKCVDLGVDKIAPRIYFPGIWALHGRGGAYLNPTLSSVAMLKKEVEELRKDYNGVIEISTLDLSMITEKKEIDVPRCSGLISSCTILENGLIVPCETLADFSEDFIIGNIREKSLTEIWNSKKAAQWRSRTGFIAEGPCSSCNEFMRCLGGCPWKSIVSYSKWKCDPHCVRSPKAEIPMIKIKKGN